MNKKIPNEDLGRIDIDTFKSSKKTPIIVILDNIRSLNNIGTVFRTADAFLIEKIYLCGITATPPHRDIRKTALGATQSVDWEYQEDIHQLVAKLQEQNVHVCAIEQAEKKTYLDKFVVPQNNKVAIVFGNEIEGVQQSVIDMCNEVIEIPQLGTKHSLNIAVSAGVVLWELFKQTNSISSRNL